MEEDFISKRLEKLEPYLRGFQFDPNDLYSRISVVFPAIWNYRSLVDKGLVLEYTMTPNNSSYLMTLGKDPKKSTDITIDELLNDFEDVINLNKKEEQKQKLLQQRIAQMQSMSLEDIENLSLPPVDENYIATIAPVIQYPLPTISHFPEMQIQQPAFHTNQPPQEMYNPYATDMRTGPLPQHGMNQNHQLPPIGPPDLGGVMANTFDESKMFEGYGIEGSIYPDGEIQLPQSREVFPLEQVSRGPASYQMQPPVMRQVPQLGGIQYNPMEERDVE